MIIDKYVSNPDLPTIKEDWPGTPVTAKGRFLNHQLPYIPRTADILKWKSRPNPEASAKRADSWRLPIQPIDDLSDLSDNSMIWLGHASFIIKIGGYTIAIDPIYDSPTWIMPRYSKLPLDPAGVVDVDLLLLSHDHRDHADASSLRYFCKRNPQTDIYTGLGMTKLISRYSLKQRIIEAGWYQLYPHPELKITYVPMRHWGKRWLFDTNTRLWGGFHIQCGDKAILFGSDSGYGGHYQEIKETLGTVHIAMIGIGAYKPEWFMHPSHTSPQDAYRAATDLEAAVLVPMHYGTFDLSDESISDPYRAILDVETTGPRIAAIHPGEVLTF